MLICNQLAFLENPVALVLVGAMALILFGPDKMKEIAMQLGKAIRDVRKMGTDFKNTLDGDDSHENVYKSDYTPAQYDSYGNRIEDGTSNYSAYLPEIEASKSPETTITADPPRGDFAASAFADTSNEYGVAPAVTTNAEEVQNAPLPALEVKPADNAVSRSKQTAGV